MNYRLYQISQIDLLSNDERIPVQLNIIKKTKINEL